MRSGTKNCVVSIYSFTESADATDNSPVWSETAFKSDIFAHYVPRRGRETEVDGKIQAETYAKFEFDYYDVVGLTESMYILHDGLKYDIKAILPDLDLKEYIVVDATLRRDGTQRA